MKPTLNTDRHIADLYAQRDAYKVQINSLEKDRDYLYKKQNELHWAMLDIINAFDKNDGVSLDAAVDAARDLMKTHRGEATPEAQPDEQLKKELAPDEPRDAGNESDPHSSSESGSPICQQCEILKACLLQAQNAAINLASDQGKPAQRDATYSAWLDNARREARAERRLELADMLDAEFEKLDPKEDPANYNPVCGEYECKSCEPEKAPVAWLYIEDPLDREKYHVVFSKEECLPWINWTPIYEQTANGKPRTGKGPIGSLSVEIPALITPSGSYDPSTVLFDGHPTISQPKPEVAARAVAWWERPDTNPSGFCTHGVPRLNYCEPCIAAAQGKAQGEPEQKAVAYAYSFGEARRISYIDGAQVLPDGALLYALPPAPAQEQG
ncbi:hypothetical protein BH09PSE6_BH09PSE6_17900 [soil metagenome]